MRANGVSPSDCILIPSSDDPPTLLCPRFSQLGTFVHILKLEPMYLLAQYCFLSFARFLNPYPSHTLALVRRCGHLSYLQLCHGAPFLPER